MTGPFTGTVKAVAGRTYTLHALWVDAAHNEAPATTDVTVANDTTAPVISSVSA